MFMRQINWFRLMLFSLMILFACNAIYKTISISSMDDEELKQYVKEELYPQKKRVSRSYNFFKETLYNLFGRYGFVFYYWIIAFICIILLKIEQIMSDCQATKLKNQEEKSQKALNEAELAKRRKRFNKHKKKKD